jgi:hypothetical protein
VASSGALAWGGGGYGTAHAVEALRDLAAAFPETGARRGRRSHHFVCATLYISQLEIPSVILYKFYTK